MPPSRGRRRGALAHVIAAAVLARSSVASDPTGSSDMIPQDDVQQGFGGGPGELGNRYGYGLRSDSRNLKHYSLGKDDKGKWAHSELKKSDKGETLVLQRHGHPPVAWDNSRSGELGWEAQTEEDLLHLYDEVTLEFKTQVPVHTIELRLPDRQQCKQDKRDDGSLVDVGCDGYTFAKSPEGGCELRRGRAAKLPSDPNTAATDLVSTGLVGQCKVDNTYGNPKPNKDGSSAADMKDIPKRSVAIITLRTDNSGDPNVAKVTQDLTKVTQDGSQPKVTQDQPKVTQDTGGWNYLTLFVKNPPITPTGKDALFNTANSFEVVLKDAKGEIIIAQAHEAMNILQAWVCTYTPWRRLSECTAKCGGGIRYSIRSKLHPPPEGYDPALLLKCDLELVMEEPCNKFPCDVDCLLGDWIRWADGPCTATCGGGIEVQRRRVVQGAQGAGKPCTHWMDDTKTTGRVRYVECNPDPCPDRCEMATAHLATAQSDSPNVVPAPCSFPCGGSKRQIFGLGIRKDNKFDATKCFNEKTETCPDAACKVFDFFPARPGVLPEAGKWFDVLMMFFLKDLSCSFDLRAPPGFEFAPEDEDECRLVEHDLPRIARCEVIRGKPVGQQVARFTFFNTLEPQLPLKEYPNAYRVRMWVKNTEDCVDIDNDGICKAKPGGREWTLAIKSNLPADLWEYVTGGYEVYAPGRSRSFRELARLQAPGMMGVKSANAGGKKEEGTATQSSGPGWKSQDGRSKVVSDDQTSIATLPGGQVLKIAWNPQP